VISLEHIAPEDWAAVERVRQVLQSLVPDTGGRSIGVRFGVSTLTWPGGVAGSSIGTVTHGLGRTPVCVLATVNAGGVAGPAWTGTPGATTFPLAARTADGSSPGAGTTTSVSWVVIG
jgi:hypothetical protein